MTKVLLVDFENVQKVNLAELPGDVHVRFVLGAKQKSLPTALAVQSQPLGERFKHVLIKDMAPNAVDFCIAYYLGRVLAQDPKAECVILSKDEGRSPSGRALRKGRRRSHAAQRRLKNGLARVQNESSRG